jgi:hypothetical protein
LAACDRWSSAARALYNDLAHRRWHHAARPPLEKCIAELPLQLRQALRQRGLRQADYVGGGGNAAMFADRQQRAQVPQIKVERIGRHAAYSCYPAPATCGCVPRILLLEDHVRRANMRENLMD